MPFEPEGINSFSLDRATRGDFQDAVALPVMGPDVRSLEEATIPNPILYYRLKINSTYGRHWPYNVPSIYANKVAPQTGYPPAQFSTFADGSQFMLPASREVLVKTGASSARKSNGLVRHMAAQQTVLTYPAAALSSPVVVVNPIIPLAMPTPYPPVYYRLTLHPGQPRLTWDVPDLVINIQAEQQDQVLIVTATNYSNVPGGAEFFLYGQNVLAHERVPTVYADSISGDSGSGSLFCEFFDGPPRFRCSAILGNSDLPFNYRFILQAIGPNELATISFQAAISGVFPHS